MTGAVVGSSERQGSLDQRQDERSLAPAAIEITITDHMQQKLLNQQVTATHFVALDDHRHASQPTFDCSEILKMPAL